MNSGYATTAVCASGSIPERSRRARDLQNRGKDECAGAATSRLALREHLMKSAGQSRAPAVARLRIPRAHVWRARSPAQKTLPNPAQSSESSPHDTRASVRRLPAAPVFQAFCRMGDSCSRNVALYLLFLNRLKVWCEFCGACWAQSLIGLPQCSESPLRLRAATLEQYQHTLRAGAGTNRDCCVARRSDLYRSPLAIC